MAPKKDSKSIKAKAKAAANASHLSSTPAKPTDSQSFIQEITNSIHLSYKSYLNDLQSSQKLRLIDTFLGFLVSLGILQFVYCCLIGNFPFNAFLGGFIATVGQFVLTVSLRLQTTATPKQEVLALEGGQDDQAEQIQDDGLFKFISPERAFGDYVFASLILHFVVIHFIN